MDPVLPALDGASIAGIVPALLGGRDASWLPSAALDAEAVVLLVLDGLGWNVIDGQPELVPTLASLEGGPITSVVPSTTAAALTSITTGLPPAVHGVLGYRMLVDGAVLNVLRWSVADAARAPDPLVVQRHDPFLGKDVPAITQSEFRNSGFTRAHLRGARFVGWHTTTALVEHCVRGVRAGERFVYAYYSGIDNVAHEFGLRDEVYRRELAFADSLVADLRDALPAHAALLVTSDHGQVHLERESWVELDALRDLVAVMAGDGRFRYLHAKPGRQRDLLAAAREVAGDLAWVRSRAEVLEAGWLGRGPSGVIPGRMGDVVLAASADVGFVDPALPYEAMLRSAHGSLTPQEMWVPLLAAAGRG